MGHRRRWRLHMQNEPNAQAPRLVGGALFGFVELTLFLSSSLLFWLQPMVGKTLLPLLGGTPALWTTCMVFFQAGLLAGYAYAHVLSVRLGVRGQMLVHLALLVPPLLLLPTDLGETGPSAAAEPVLWLLGTLLVTVGPAFVLVASCGPLWQRWFSLSGHTRAADPYFLYVA